MDNEHHDLPPFPSHPAPMRSSYAIPGAIATVVLVGICLHFISDALLPVVAALFLANIFMPLVDFLQKKKVPTTFSIIIVLVLVAGILFGVFIIISISITSIVEVFPKYQTKWNAVFLPDISNFLGNISPTLKQKTLDFDLRTAFNGSEVASGLSSITNSLVSIVSGFALIMLFMLFILAGTGQFRVKLKRAFPPSSSQRLGDMFIDIDKRVSRYLTTTVLLNALSGVAMSIVLALFGVDLAIFWGLLTFLLTFIPSIGSIFAAILPISVAFVQFDSVGTPIAVAVTVLVTQILIGSVLTPRIMGGALNLSPLLILVSLIFWGWVWGPWGMVLSVPITSTLAIIFESIPSLQPLAILMSSDSRKEQKRIKARRTYETKTGA